MDITYDSEVERLKKWVIERTEWIDGHLDELKKIFYTVTLQIDDTPFTTLTVEKGDMLLDHDSLPVPPQKDGYIFRGWFVKGEDGKEIQLKENMEITQNMTATAKYQKRTKDTEVQKIAFAQQDIYMTRYDDKTLQYCVIPFDAYAGKITWKSSDESIASIYEGKALNAKDKIGDAVITATTENGTTASFTVHVTDEYKSLKSVDLNTKEITIKEGEYAQAQVVYTPEDAITYRSVTFDSSDESIAKVNNCGYIYGVSEGTAIIVTYDYEFGLKSCKVTVTGKTPAPLKKGDLFTTGELKYKVTKTGKKKEAQCIGTTNKKIKKLVIPSTIAGGVLFRAGVPKMYS